MCLGFQDQIGHIGHITGQEHQAVLTLDRKGLSCYQPRQKTDTHHNQIIDEQSAFNKAVRNLDWPYQRCCPQDTQDVENVTAYQVADADIHFFAYCGHDGCGQFRNRSSESNDCQTDKLFADSDLCHNSHSSIDQNFGTDNNTDDSGCNP